MSSHRARIRGHEVESKQSGHESAPAELGSPLHKRRIASPEPASSGTRGEFDGPTPEANNPSVIRCKTGVEGDKISVVDEKISVVDDTIFLRDDTFRSLARTSRSFGNEFQVVRNKFHLVSDDILVDSHDTSVESNAF